MPSLSAPTFSPSAASAAASSANASGARARDADEPSGRAFSAALDRSRNAGAAQASDEAGTAEGVARRKPGRAAERKDDAAPTEPLPLAFFAPMTAGTLPQATPAADTGAAALPADGLTAVPGSTLDAGIAQAADATDAEAAEGDAAEALARTAPEGLGDGAQAAAAAPLDDDGGGAALQAAVLASMPRGADAGKATAAKDEETGDTPLADAPDAVPAKGVGDTATATSAKSAPAADDVIAAAASSSSSSTSSSSSSSEAAGNAIAAPGAAPSDAASGTPWIAPHALQTHLADRAATASTPTTVPVLHVAPSVGSEAWGQAIGQQMLRMTAAGHQVAELNLNPAGLGPLKVTLSMADNQAQAMFVSAHESVRRAVEAALPQLRASMADSGISLGQASVGAEAHPSPQQGGAFGEQPGRQQQGSSRQAAYPGAERLDAGPAAEAARVLRTGRTLVDTFA